MKKFGWILAGIAALALAIPVIAGTTTTFTTTDGAVAIADNTGALGNCQTITVAAMPTQIDDITVEITASHSWVGDLTFRLDPPAGTNLTVLNRPGRVATGAGNSDDLVTGTPVTYSDTAASAVSAEAMGTACGGVINGTAGCEDNYLPAPNVGDTPIAGEGTTFAQFDTLDPNGVWTLCAGDSAAGDTGTLTSWSITVSSSPVELESFSIE